jgi:S1-C subfamily serine protease
MILTTSGSNAGIGFAIPIDAVREKSDGIIEKDRLKSSSSTKRRPSRGWLGVEIVADTAVDEALRKKLRTANKDHGVFILNVKPGSPAFDAGIQGLTFPSDDSGVMDIGDRIIALGGRTIENRRDLETDLKSRVEGEQLSITVENANGDRRVLYIALKQKPL